MFIFCCGSAKLNVLPLKQLCYIELEFRSIITLQRLTVLEHFFKMLPKTNATSLELTR